MADEDWSDSGRDNLKKKDKSRKSGGIDSLMRVMYPISNLASLRTGGKVRKTGPVNVHEGERVVPKSKVRKVERMMRKGKMRMTNKRRKSSGR